MRERRGRWTSSRATGARDTARRLWCCQYEGGCTSEAQWQSQSTRPRFQNGEMVVMGGYDGTARNDVWQSHDQGISWAQVAANALWSARYYHRAVALEVRRSRDHMEGGVFHFLCPSIGVLRAVRSLSWADMGTSMTSGGPSTVLDRGNSCRRQVGPRDTDMRRLSSRCGEERLSLLSVLKCGALCLQNSKILVLGGYHSTSPYYRQDVWQSVDNGTSWTSLTLAAAWVARREHAVVVLNVRSC